jgi:hypothetical protein
MGINDCFRALTKCGKCLGCNKLLIDSFKGDNTCFNFRNGYQKEADKPEPYDSRKHDNWRPKK